MKKVKLVEGLAEEELPKSYRRYADGEVDGTLCFCDEEDHNIVGFDLTAGKNAVHLFFIRYESERAPLAAEIWSTGVAKAFKGEHLGPLPLIPDDSRVRGWLRHYRKCWNQMPFAESNWSLAFREWKEPSDEDRSAAVMLGMRQLSRELATLERNEILVPFGTLWLEQVPDVATRHGMVPSHSVLRMSAGSAGVGEWVTRVGFAEGMFLTENQFRDVLSLEFQKRENDIREGRTWEIDGGAGSIYFLVNTKGELTVEPSLEYVRHINSGNAAFCRFLESLDDWKEAYEPKEDVGGALNSLIEKVNNQPADMSAHRALAKYYESVGEVALAHLSLARGYLNKGSLGVARGKLELARSADPNCPGLEEVDAQLKSGR